MGFAKRERKREEILFGRKWILTWVWHTVNLLIEPVTIIVVSCIINCVMKQFT
jgi:hypothetical protein